MKVQVTQANLSRALSAVGRVAGGRTSLPILANILISTEDNQLKIAATNLEIAITQFIGAKVEKTGSLTVPARLVTDFISSLPDSNIDLSVEDNKLHISAGSYTSTINGVSSEEFPSIPTVSASQSIKLSSEELKKAISQTVIAASSDEARPVLTGVYIYSDNGTAIMVATDSYRLAERKLSKNTQQEINVIVPARTFSEVQRIIDEQDQTEIFFDENQMMIAAGEVQLVSKLIDGKFPAYKQLIPEKSDVTITILRSELLSITKVAALFARESAGSVTLEVDEEKQEVSIASVASQVGENTSRATAKVKGSGKVTLNSRFLIDALNVVSDKEIIFRFSGSTNPCIVEPTGDEKNIYQHIVMPLRS